VNINDFKAVIDSAANSVFQLGDFLRCMHDALLDEGLILFEFDDLSLHVFVFIALPVDLVR
jgi:hypothetical protein